MKKFGLIGGLGPESTIAYYRLIIKRFQEITGTNSYPDFLIKIVDMTAMTECVINKDYDKLVDFLADGINDLQRAGVDFGAIASNTPHIVYEKLKESVDLPLVSIVEEACKAAQSKNIKKVGLFGTKSTMINGFYQKTAVQYGLDLVIPTENQVDYIHDKYMNELIYKDIRAETKEGLIQIAKDLQDKHSIEGLILGGTELSLILNQADFEGVHLLDTAIIHVDSIVNKIIND